MTVSKKIPPKCFWTLVNNHSCNEPFMKPTKTVISISCAFHRDGMWQAWRSIESPAQAWLYLECSLYPCNNSSAHISVQGTSSTVTVWDSQCLRRSQSSNSTKTWRSRCTKPAVIVNVTLKRVLWRKVSHSPQPGKTKTQENWGFLGVFQLLHHSTQQPVTDQEHFSNWLIKRPISYYLSWQMWHILPQFSFELLDYGMCRMN